jgi:hypothetical protein
MTRTWSQPSSPSATRWSKPPACPHNPRRSPKVMKACVRREPAIIMTSAASNLEKSPLLANVHRIHYRPFSRRLQASAVRILSGSSPCLSVSASNPHPTCRNAFNRAMPASAPAFVSREAALHLAPTRRCTIFLITLGLIR